MSQRLMDLVIDPDNPDELMNIFLDECLKWYTNKQRKLVYLHKNGKEYIAAQMLDDFDNSERIYHGGHQRIDANNFVKIDEIVSYSKEKGEVYFDENKTKAASVARFHASYIKHLLKSKGLLR